MIRGFLAISASILTLCAASAKAEGVSFQDFKRYCVETQADRRAALAAAGVDSWIKAKAEDIRALGVTGNSDVLARPGTAPAAFLVVGDDVDEIGGKPVVTSACALVVKGGSPADFKQQAQQFANVPPREGPGGAAMWILATDEAGRPISPAPWDAQSLAAVQAGRLRMMMIGAERGLVMLGYSVPRFKGSS